MSYVYSIYGLGVSSNLPIPGLVTGPATTRVDVHLYLGSIPSWLSELLQVGGQKWFISPYEDGRGEPVLTVWRLTGGGYFQLCYSDGTRFVVDRNGAQIWATWPDTSTLEDLSTYLLGPVMGFVLRLRGATCLHASAIVVDNQAIALVGVAGAGKSTTAAAFAERGYAVLSDDIVAMWAEEGTFLVQPGYPRLRLWPASVDALFGEVSTLPRPATT